MEIYTEENYRDIENKFTVYINLHKVDVTVDCSQECGSAIRLQYEGRKFPYKKYIANSTLLKLYRHRIPKTD